MSAETFFHGASGKTAEEAFHKAVEEAQYNWGHAGDTGTIAEKSSFVMIDLPEGMDPKKYADHLIGKDDDRIDDKWGPAGCIDCGDGTFLFFGWASS